MSEQITKIKVNEDLTAIVYYKENSNNTDTREIVFKGGEKITDEFNTAFQKSKSTFGEIIPLLKDDLHKIRMISISFEYNEVKQINKVSYNVKYTPQKGVKTEIPVKNLPIYDETIKSFTVSGKDVDLLYEILDYANKYIKGDTRTKQMKIEVV